MLFRSNENENENESGNISYLQTKNTIALRVKRKGEVLIVDSQLSSFNDQYCRDISNQIISNQINLIESSQFVSLSSSVS